MTDKYNTATYAIDKQVKYTTEVTYDGARREEQTVSHDFEAHLKAHSNHKCVLSNLHRVHKHSPSNSCVSAQHLENYHQAMLITY